LLQTGTEHWRTVYQQSISDLNPNGLNGNSSINYRTNAGAGQGNNNQGNGQGANGNQGFGQTGSQIGGSGTRSHSLGGKTNAQLAEEQARLNSYKNRPYMNNAKTGITDYKFNYG